jgi:predicted CoA-binding protein
MRVLTSLSLCLGLLSSACGSSDPVPDPEVVGFDPLKTVVGRTDKTRLRNEARHDAGLIRRVAEAPALVRASVRDRRPGGTPRPAGPSACAPARGRRDGRDLPRHSLRLGPPIDDIPTLRRILSTGRTIAVVGLSADWFRPSFFAAKYMLDHGYPEILGRKAYASLRDVPVPVDMVDVFRRTADVTPIAREAGLDSVMDRCVKIEHGRLFGGLGWACVDTKVISAKQPAWNGVLAPAPRAGGAS